MSTNDAARNVFEAIIIIIIIIIIFVIIIVIVVVIIIITIVVIVVIVVVIIVIFIIIIIIIIIIIRPSCCLSNPPCFVLLSWPLLKTCSVLSRRSSLKSSSSLPSLFDPLTSVQPSAFYMKYVKNKHHLIRVGNTVSGRCVRSYSTFKIIC